MRREFADDSHKFVLVAVDPHENPGLTAVGTRLMITTRTTGSGLIGTYMTQWHDRLNRIQAGTQEKPAVVEIMRLPDIVSWEPGKLTTKWKVDPDFFAAGGQLFGGYIASLADQVLGHTAMTVLPNDAWFRTVDLSLSYYRPVRTGTIWIHGRVAHASRQLIHVDVDFRDEDENLLCVARGVQSVFPMTPRAEN